MATGNIIMCAPKAHVERVWEQFDSPGYRNLQALVGKPEPTYQDAVRTAATATANTLRHIVSGGLRRIASGVAEEVHVKVAEVAIRAVEGLSNGAALDRTEVNALAAALARHLFHVRALLWPENAAALPGDGDNAGRAARGVKALGEIRDGMLWLDAIGAEYLRSLGEEGARLAAGLEAKARERVRNLTASAMVSDLGNGAVSLRGYAPHEPSPSETPEIATPDSYLFWQWYDPDHEPTPVRYAVRLAKALWVDKVKIRCAQIKTPALAAEFAKAATRAYFEPGREVDSRDCEPVILGRDGARVAVANSAVAAVPPMLLRDGGSLAMASLTAQRVFRDIPHRARAQAIKGNVDLDEWTPLITIVGGLTAYAEKLGIGPNQTNELRSALNLFQSLNAVGSDGTRYHGLLTWEEEPATRGRKARIIITPARALLTGSRGKLIPVPHRLPRFAGSKREWSAQASLQLLVLLEMRTHGRELAQHGGTTIRADKWLELAGQAGVSRERLTELLASTWVNDGQDGPAFLKCNPDGRWTLAPAYARELGVLSEGGRWDLGARVGGLKSAAKRGAKMTRLIKGGEKAQ